MPKTKISTLSLRIEPGIKEAVREAGRDVELPEVLGGEHDADVFSEVGRPASHVHSHIEDLAIDDAYQLPLRVCELHVEAAQRTLSGTGVVVLDEDRVLVENVNLAKKHMKPNPTKGEPGGIVEKEMPIQASNVALFNPATGKADRVGFKTLDDGRKVRVFKSNGEVLDA